MVVTFLIKVKVAPAVPNVALTVSAAVMRRYAAMEDLSSVGFSGVDVAIPVHNTTKGESGLGGVVVRVGLRGAVAMFV